MCGALLPGLGPEGIPHDVLIALYLIQRIDVGDLEISEQKPWRFQQFTVSSGLGRNFGRPGETGCSVYSLKCRARASSRVTPSGAEPRNRGELSSF